MAQKFPVLLQALSTESVHVGLCLPSILLALKEVQVPVRGLQPPSLPVKPLCAVPPVGCPESPQQPPAVCVSPITPPTFNALKFFCPQCPPHLIWASLSVEWASSSRLPSPPRTSP